MEVDACDQSAGSKGLARAGERCARPPRPRGMPLRGRATAETGRPPLLGWVPRRDQAAQDAPAAPGSLAVLGNGRPAPITPRMAATGKGGAHLFTAEDRLYPFPAASYDHRPVHQGAGAYARRAPDGTCGHWNPRDGIGAGLRHFLDHGKGISPRCLHLRVVRDEFLHNHTPLHWYQTFEPALRYICSTTGDYLRQMTHQHRRMPLTLCYR